jgi:lipopolysaccharide export system protein LptA
MHPRLAELAVLSLAAVMLTAPSLSLARESDRNEPMSVQADDLDSMLEADGDSTLVGNVEISQGTLRISADRATVSRKSGDIARVVFEGRPASMQQQNDNGTPMRASANRIDYDVSAESVLLTGNVAVRNGDDDLRGERISYDLNSGRLQSSGDGSSAGRIRMTIQPRATKPKAESSTSKEAGDTP